MSFGQHRSKVIAEAAVASVRDGVDAHDCLTERLRHALIDPLAPWRNTTSPAIDVLGLTDDAPDTPRWS